ncbi:ATP-binding protein [Hydrogenimonas sp.]
MADFSRLDALLEKQIESIVLETAKEDGVNPFFISAESITKGLKDPVDLGFSLDGLDDVAERLRLDAFEKQVLLTVIAPLIYPKYGKIYAYLQDDMNKPYPTVHLIASMFSQNAQEYKEILGYFASDASKLLLLRLVAFEKTAGVDLFSSPLKPAGSVISLLLGSFDYDEPIAGFCSLLPPKETEKSRNSALTRQLSLLRERKERAVINLYGEGAGRKVEEALSVASDFGFGITRVSCEKIDTGTDLKAMLQILLRDALLSGTLLFFDHFEALLNFENDPESTILETLDSLSWVSFVSTKEAWHPLNRHGDLHIIRHQSGNDKVYLQNVWQNALQKIQGGALAALSQRLPDTFDLSEEAIGEIAKELTLKAEAGEPVEEQNVLALCAKWAGPQMEPFAQKLKKTSSFEDIVLPCGQKESLKEIVSHYRHSLRVFGEWGLERHFQSRGISVLFSGPSGTGKTLAATIVAKELGLEIYRIDLSALVSKYIGETEKNLSKIFSAAEKLQAVLFFDEADSVFGKRSETKDAHDRYANIEVSYLLQKIESYDGVVILATNFKKNIDEAFMRRMRFIVDFPLPGLEERKEIWQKLLDPLAMPLGEIDHALLAQRFKLSGAGIRNAVLYAAFKAAEENSEIGMVHLIEGIREEMAKSGKNINEKDFDIAALGKDGRG